MIKFSGPEKSKDKVCHVFALPDAPCLFNREYCQGSFPVKECDLFSHGMTEKNKMMAYYKCRTCIEKNMVWEITDEQNKDQMYS